MLGALVLALQAAPAPPPARGWDDFPVFVWRERHAERPLPEGLARPFGGVLLMRGEDSAWARAGGLSYLVWNAAGREPLHLDADGAWRARVEAWIADPQGDALVRRPCWNDPEVRAALVRTLAATLGRHGARPGLGFVLGDEVGLTPNGDPFDLCRCAPCEARWRTWAAEHGAAERAPLTGEVLARLRAGESEGLGDWLARRRFDRLELADALASALRQARTAPTPVPLGVLGLNAGLFAGLAFEPLLGELDFVEAYPQLDTRERLASHAAPPALATVFVEQETPAGAAWVAWEHWAQGGAGLVLWNDAALEDHAPQRARLSESVAEIRALQARFPHLPRPRLSSFSIVRDEDSNALAWLLDAREDGDTWPRRTTGYQAAHGTRERALAAWLAALSDAGIAPVVRALGELDARAGEGTWLVSYARVLGAGDVARLERHLAAGGRLLVEGELGSFDRAGRRRTEDVRARLARLAPGRVLAPPPGLEDYPERRADVAGTAALRSALRALSPPLHELRFAGEAARVPWLVTVRGPVGEGADTGELVTLLPAWTRAEERARRLVPLVLELTPPPGMALEWLHPRVGEPLPAGDAVLSGRAAPIVRA